MSDCHRWLCTSTNPGNTIVPVASTILAPEPSSPLPTAAMRSSSMHTSPPGISPSSPSPNCGSMVMTRSALRMRVRRIVGLLCWRLVMGRPAIHIDCLAGNKVAVLRGQKNHRPRQVRGLFNALDDLLVYDPGAEAGHRLRV